MGRSSIAGAMLLAAAALAQPQASPDPDGVLARARAKISASMKTLPRYACIQTIDRSYLSNPTYSRPRTGEAMDNACDQIGAGRKRNARPPRLDATDRLRLDVAQGDGREMHSWPGANRFDTRDIDRLVTHGPIGTGAFGGYLVDIFENDGAQFDYRGPRMQGNSPVFVYGFRLAREVSHYQIGAGDSWIATAYSGTFEIDPSSAELLSITVETSELPPETHLCQAISTMDYQRTRLGGVEFLLPRQSHLHLVLRDDRETDNRIVFTGCREFHAESELHFDGESAPLPSAPSAAASGSQDPLPAGLPLELRLSQPIDTATAAAGDAVTFIVTRAARLSRSSPVLVPAGAIAHGRLSRVEHRLVPSQYFAIGIAFQSLETGGASRPFAARIDRSTLMPNPAGPGFQRLQRRLPAVAPDSFLFPSDAGHYVMRSGILTEWVSTTGPRDTR